MKPKIRHMVIEAFYAMDKSKLSLRLIQRYLQAEYMHNVLAKKQYLRNAIQTLVADGVLFQKAKDGKFWRIKFNRSFFMNREKFEKKKPEEAKTVKRMLEKVPKVQKKVKPVAKMFASNVATDAESDPEEKSASVDGQKRGQKRKHEDVVSGDDITDYEDNACAQNVDVIASGVSKGETDTDEAIQEPSGEDTDPEDEPASVDGQTRGQKQTCEDVVSQEKEDNNTEIDNESSPQNVSNVVADTEEPIEKVSREKVQPVAKIITGDLPSGEDTDPDEEPAPAEGQTRGQKRKLEDAVTEDEENSAQDVDVFANVLEAAADSDEPTRKMWKVLVGVSPSSEVTYAEEDGQEWIFGYFESEDENTENAANRSTRDVGVGTDPVVQDTFPKNAERIVLAEILPKH